MITTPEVIELVNERTKLNIWFNEFLDENSDAMDELNNKHPLWQPYNENLTRYREIENRLRVLNYVQQSK